VTKQPQQSVRNLLTDEDTHALGLQGLATRMQSLEQQLRGMDERTKAAISKASAGSPPPSEQTLMIDQQALDQSLQIEELRTELDRMRTQLAEKSLATETAAASAVPQPAPSVPPTPTLTTERPLGEIFTPSHAAGPIAATAHKIRMIVDERAPDEALPLDAVFIPAGAILRGVLLSGLDAPTGQAARRDPMPALIRIKHNAILPNGFAGDVRECFVLVGGYGDMGSERAYLRTETLSCVRTDGGVIEVAIDGYAVGEDGKVGLRGRLVSKQGAILAKALTAGFLQSFSGVFNQIPSIPISDNGEVRYNSVLNPQALQSGAAAGAGGAMERLANYYMDQAEQIYPVLEIDAGRAVELILNKGASLRLNGSKKRSR